MLALANIKIYANKKDLVIDTEMIVDKNKLRMDHAALFMKLMEKKKYEYDLNDLLSIEFEMIINFIEDKHVTYYTSREYMNGLSRTCKFYEDDDNLVVY